MPPSRNKSIDRAWAVLALFENDGKIIQKEVADMLGVSRTQLRRDLKSLLDLHPDDPALSKRISAVRRRTATRTQGGRATIHDETDVHRIRAIQKQIPDLNSVELAELLGTSRAALWRALRRYPDETEAEAKTQSSSTNNRNSKRLQNASFYIPAAVEAFDQLHVPNDLSETHRDLFVLLTESVRELRDDLQRQDSRSNELERENPELLHKLENSIPLWEEAWGKFVLNAAESAGSTAGKGAVFAAGFIAGSLVRMLK